MANQPNIRSKGFTEEWRKIRLKDIGEAISGIGFPEESQGGKNGVPFYKVSDMSSIGNEFSMQNANNYVTEEQIRKHGWKPICKLPAILFAKVGAAVFLNRKRLVLSPALSDNNTMMFSFNKEICETFFAKYLFDNIYLPSLVQVGTLPSYNGSQVESIVVFIPKEDEQKRISSILNELTTSILRREAELEKLKNIKRALLEKLFPQNGEKVPALRFKEFTEEWEETCIGNAFQERDERSANGELLSVTINSGIRRAKEMERTFVTGDLSHYKVVRVGDIAYNTMRMWQGACGVSDYTGIVSPAYTIATPQKGHCSAFYACLFKTNNLLHEFRINSQGLTSDTWNLKYHNFSNIKITVPIEREQQKIANIFLAVNNLLSLREKQLTLLKHTKQALLEQMFVNE